ncbi:GNAT family N-acetyltransferase [Paenibacillus lautus]|uniref:GNAT family N-acetyltransferase n=1 Tax=Paenibacillus lautus TaxID=1401 RepID=UPI002DBFCB2D|nr:GNAT family N-acetyltransferase [Paenibacillus lautus]MEC0255865.1 GNAT family N-acetyltransferase [Paenibacillus lautus]
MFPILETKRLKLREIQHQDAGAIYSCFSNDEVTRYYGQDTLTTPEQAIHMVELFATNYAEKRGIRWGIERKDTQGLIGTIGYNVWSPRHKRAEIGYEIHPEFWGQGYAIEAASAVIAYGFQVLGLTRIGAVVFLENQASHALLTKLGFEAEGILRQYIYQNGVAHDTRVYSILKTNHLR